MHNNLNILQATTCNTVNILRKLLLAYNFLKNFNQHQIQTSKPLNKIV